MNEFGLKLSEPRRKRVPPGLKPKQAFPVPISSLTGMEASDDTWRWYDAELIGKEVRVTDADSVKMLSNLGYFGELRRQGESPEEFVGVEDFDPVVPELSGEADDSENASVAVGEAESSSDSEAGETKTPARGCGNWKSAKIQEDILILSHYDAFFLAYGLGCLRVAKDDVYMSIDDLWNDFCVSEPNFRRRYVAYHYFRAKNWIVRDGTKFGNDFLLYKDGPPFYHASYSVRVQDGKSGMNWIELASLNRVTETAAKELLIVEVLEDVSKLKEKMTPPEYFDAVDVREVLARRWVAAHLKDDGAL